MSARDRVRSLDAIDSTTAAERIGQPRPRPTRRQVMGGVTGTAGLIAAGAASPARAAAAGAADGAASARPQPMNSRRVRRWARDTWHCLDAMTDERTGLVADNSPESLGAGDRSG